MTRDERTSPWLYVGLGCVAAVVVLVGLLIAFGWFARNQLKRLEAEMKDPAARAAKVEKILGARELPEGYYPAFAMSVPFVLEMAVLSDVPGEEGGDSGPDHMRFEERGFIYTETLGSGSRNRELERYFADKGPPPTTFGTVPSNLEGDLVAHGELPVDRGHLLFRTLRGRFPFGKAKQGLATLFLVRCSADQRSRSGIWFGPDPSPTTPAAELDLRGTTGDPQAIGSFIGHFELCPPAG